MPTFLLLVLFAAEVTPRTILDEVQDCYRISELAARKACLDKAMTPAPGEESQTSWVATKSVDSMTDVRQCTVSAYLASFEGNLQIFYVQDLAPRVAIVAKPYPNDPGVLRVDELEAVRSASGIIFEPEPSKVVIAQLRDGTFVRTRFNDWPSRVPIENTMDVRKIDQAMNECEAYTAAPLD
jgi:hypothetical protein